MRMRPMDQRSPIVGPVRALGLTLVLTGALAACGTSEEVAPVVAADLPGDLCSLVPPSVVERWSLAVEDQHVRGGESVKQAMCSMSGMSAGEAVTLEVRLTSYGGADVESARSVALGTLADSCADLEASGVGTFQDS
ncbi:MAG: hypothetical protein ABJ382_16685, partial [Ilumatobacter sp.]